MTNELATEDSAKARCLHWAFIEYLGRKPSSFVLEAQFVQPQVLNADQVLPEADQMEIDSPSAPLPACCEAKEAVLASKDEEIARLRAIIQEKDNEIRRLKRRSGDGAVPRNLRPVETESDLIQLFKRSNTNEVSPQMTQLILGEIIHNRASTR